MLSSTLQLWNWGESLAAGSGPPSGGGALVLDPTHSEQRPRQLQGGATLTGYHLEVMVPGMAAAPTSQKSAVCAVVQ